MTLISIVFLELPFILIKGFWLTWWFNCLIVSVAALWAVIYHKLKVKALCNEHDEMERKMLEKKELLSHAVHEEQKLREAADMANRSKSTLLSKITHEIRTPLNAMMGMASLLNQSYLTPEQRGFSSHILQSGDGLLTLINEILMNDILEFSKIDAGKELELKNFDLRNSIEEVLDVFAAKAAKANIDLAYKIADNVPPHLIGDSYRLRQILMNLVENAFRFTTAGEIFVGVNAVDSNEGHNCSLEFTVRDTGRGMTPERLQLVIKDLSSPNTAETANECIGLTLLICKKLVALMGGSISVESSLSQGTVFKFSVSAQVGLQPMRAHIQPEMAGTKGKKVLIVDDNAAIGEMISAELVKWKLLPAVAASGQKAMELLIAGHHFDLVITDLKMEEMTGIDLAGAIKQLYPSMPVILLNSIGDDTFRQHPGLLNGVVNKPVKQHLLHAEVFAAIKQKPTTVSPEKQKLTVSFAKQFPLNILIAEDDSVNQYLLKTILAKLGYQSNICSNGQEVLEEISNRKYDVILMDVQMPVMDGLEATRMIRLCISEQPVIIAMTANTLQGDREACLRAGMDDYTSKPIKLEELVRLLEKWSLHVKQSNSHH